MQTLHVATLPLKHVEIYIISIILNSNGVLEPIKTCLFIDHVITTYFFRQCWKEVNDLEKKKEEIMQKEPHDAKKESDSDEDLSEAKLDEFLDWRSKKSWR